MTDFLHQTYIGRSKNRLHPDSSNHFEVALAKSFNKHYREIFYILAKKDDYGKIRQEPTAEEMETAATVVQWLGTNVGQHVLFDAIRDYPEFLEHLNYHNNDF